MKLWDYHIHLENGPLTMEWLQRFIDKSFEEDLIEIGISEHACRFCQASGLLDGYELREKWIKEQCNEDLDEYINLIQGAKDRGYNIKLGIEMDYVPEHEQRIREFIETYPWDYVIGSVHWLDEWGFDIPDMADEWDKREINEVYYRYFNDLKKAVESGIFDIIAHPDLIKIFCYYPKEDIKNIYQEAATSIKDCGKCLEINTAGLRKPVKEIYPAEDFLKICGKEGIPIIINSDAHYPEDVGRDFNKAYDYAIKCGCTTISRFNKRERYDIDLE